MDKELSSLAEKLAPTIKESGTKKIGVLDFTDLQDKGSELGKYIAERLTVSFVIGNIMLVKSTQAIAHKFNVIL